MNEATRKGRRMALAVALGVGMAGMTGAAVVVVEDSGGEVRVHDPVRHHSDRYPARGARQGWLGIVMYGASGDGTVVKELVEDGPAAKAGLRKDDRIRAIDDVRIEDYWDITNVLRKKGPGDRVAVEVVRDGDTMSFDVTLGDRPRPQRIWTSSGGDDVGILRPHEGTVIRLGGGRPILGVDVHEMSDSLRGYFQAPEGAGVLVNKVMENSPAERAGLRAGDVIVEVDGREIRRVGDISRALRSREPGDSVGMVVIRNRVRTTLDVTLEERDDRSSLREPELMAPGVYSIPTLEGLEGLESLKSLEVLDNLEALRSLEHLRMTGEQRDALRESMRELRRQMRELREQMKEIRLEFMENRTELRDAIRKRTERMRDVAPAGYEL